MSHSTDRVIAANRFGFGARPTELAQIGNDARGALHAQLEHACPQPMGDLPTAESLIASVSRYREELQQAKRDDSASQVSVGMKLVELYRPAYEKHAIARFRLAVESDRSFVERLVHFWSNHFAVSIDKIAVLGLAGPLETEAIRPNVLGNFRDLLSAVERHPAMLVYLDNHISAGPNSPAAQFVARRGLDRKVGLNENLGREILELHTLGVDGGYTQQDVTTLAAIITGWSVGGGVGALRGGEPGRFLFRGNLHEPGEKILLGRRYAEAGVGQGEKALADLALHPRTAHHLATKLARHFVADEPPAVLVDRLARAYLKHDGDLPALYRALIDDPLTWQSAPGKFKSPSDYIHSTYRALALPVRDERRALAPFELLGQRNFQPGSPAGWPDRSADWDGPAALLKRIEWATAVGQRVGMQADAMDVLTDSLGDAVSDRTREAVGRAPDRAQALTLALASPEMMRR